MNILSIQVAPGVVILLSLVIVKDSKRSTLKHRSCLYFLHKAPGLVWDARVSGTLQAISRDYLPVRQSKTDRSCVTLQLSVLRSHSDLWFGFDNMKSEFWHLICSSWSQSSLEEKSPAGWGDRVNRTSPWPAAGTRRWLSPLRGNTSSAPRGSASCRCRWGICGGFPEVPSRRGRTGSPEAPTAAARPSSGPTCSGRACAPGAPRCNGSLWVSSGGQSRPRRSCFWGGGRERCRLTHVKLEALLGERVAAASGLAVLLQNQNFLPGFCQQHGQPEPAGAASDDDGVQVFWYLTGQET